MVVSAAELLRVHGAGATSIDRVLAHSGAPRGSVYHHFPGGRTQLIDEAVEFAGDAIAGLIDEITRTDDPVRAIDAVFALWRERLVASDFRAGCPVVAVAVETNDEAPGPARTAGVVFARWQRAFADFLMGHGLAGDRSERLAALVVAALEGALVMCRAERSTAALDATATEIHELLSHALRERPGPATAQTTDPTTAPATAPTTAPTTGTTTSTARSTP
jgi:AcrR family transcriptional regulator